MNFSSNIFQIKTQIKILKEKEFKNINKIVCDAFCSLKWSCKIKWWDGEIIIREIIATKRLNDFQILCQYYKVLLVKPITYIAMLYSFNVNGIIIPFFNKKNYVK